MQGLYLPRIHGLISIGIPIIYLAGSSDRLRFMMRIPILVDRSPELSAELVESILTKEALAGTVLYHISWR